MPTAMLNKRVFGYLSWRFRRARVDRAEVLDALVDDLMQAGPDHVVVTGDIVNISLPTEFARTAHWLADTGIAARCHGRTRQPRRLCRGELGSIVGGLVRFHDQRPGRGGAHQFAKSRRLSDRPQAGTLGLDRAIDGAANRARPLIRENWQPPARATCVVLRRGGQREAVSSWSCCIIRRWPTMRPNISALPTPKTFER